MFNIAWEAINHQSVWELAVLFLALSFIMQRLINRLPLLCQLTWIVVSSWGIIWVSVAFVLIGGISLSVAWQMALVYFAALFGMAATNYHQTRILYQLFKGFRINKQTTGLTIFFRESWLGEKLYGPVNENTPVSHPHCIRSNHPHYLTVARRRSRRYRRRYPAVH